jgi:hypothetical protein
MGEGVVLFFRSHSADVIFFIHTSTLASSELIIDQLVWFLVVEHAHPGSSPLLGIVFS